MNILDELFRILIPMYCIFTSKFAIAQELDDRKAQSPGNGVVASAMSGRLKSELLANLNRYSNNGANEQLEVLGSSDSSHVEVPRKESQPFEKFNMNERKTFWQPQEIPTSTPSLLQSLFGGLAFTLPTLPPFFAPLTLAPSFTERPPIQNFFAEQSDSRAGIFGREDRYAGSQNLYTAPVTPIPFNLPTLQSPLLGFSLGVPYASSKYEQPFRFDSYDPKSFPKTTTTIDNSNLNLATSTSRPRYVNYNISRPVYVTDTIRDWRKRFYKLFKSIKHRNFTSIAPTRSTIERLPIQVEESQDYSASEGEPLPRPDSEPDPIRIFEKKPNYTRRMQPIIVINDTRAAEMDKNRQILMSRKMLLHRPDGTIDNQPNWISEQKVKTFARDNKGRIIRLYGVENGGYKYDEDPIPLPITEPQNSDFFQGNAISPQAVYIPSGSPSTLAPPPPAFRFYSPAPPPTDPPAFLAPGSLETAAPQLPQLVSAVPLSSMQFPTLSPPPTPPPCLVTTLSSNAQINPSENYDNNEYDILDDLPCETMPCHNGNSFSMNSPIDPMVQWNGIGPPFIENNEKCNSMRLRYIIQECIIPGDAEASKRSIQERAENELSTFYNVVCGTGFFSYIAHTDEFCQASMNDVNCYVFSPVCSYKSAYSDGIVMKSRKFKTKRKKNRRKAFLNKN